MADIVIFILGVGYLSTLYGSDSAIANSLVPFIYSEIMKTALGIAVGLWTPAWLAKRRPLR